MNNSSVNPLSEFSLSLFGQISSTENVNIFISPFSIMTTLLMCLLGARNRTADQLKSVLSLNNFENDSQIITYASMLSKTNKIDSKQKFRLITANKLYAQLDYEIKRDYINLIRKNFKSGDVQRVNFGNSMIAARTINQWIADKTYNKIREIVKPFMLDMNSKLVLANALYFKALWKQPFNPRLTKKSPFYTNDQSHIEVDMMSLLEARLNYMNNSENLGAEIVELPYQMKNISMVIILPNQGVEIKRVESALTSRIIQSYFAEKIKPVKVNLEMPKFKIDFTAEVS
jgi:serpin B